MLPLTVEMVDAAHVQLGTATSIPAVKNLPDANSAVALWPELFGHSLGLIVRIP